jgi:hypothetical protein
MAGVPKWRAMSDLRLMASVWRRRLTAVNSQPGLLTPCGKACGNAMTSAMQGRSISLSHSRSFIADLSHAAHKMPQGVIARAMAAPEEKLKGLVS